jgi:cytochrome c oxidase subunit 2
MFSRYFSLIFLVTLVLCMGVSAQAQNPVVVYPDVSPILAHYKPQEISNFIEEPVTPLARQIRTNTLVTSILIIPFLIIPQILLLICIFKFRKTNDSREPAKFHENLPLEVFWTIVPAIVLILMAIPTYKLIRSYDNPPPADEIITIYGYRFGWIYEYHQHNGMKTTNNEALVVPAGKTIVANITSNDVNHAWWVPAFGVKMDAVAGRTNQVWFNVEKPGWYKGQCAEICGASHYRMLIDVIVCTPEEFDAWIAEKQSENPPAPVKVVANNP